jgi:hypothetical protein
LSYCLSLKRKEFEIESLNKRPYFSIFPLPPNSIITHFLEAPKQAKKEKKAKRQKKDKNAPKKPMSAFFCY